MVALFLVDGHALAYRSYFAFAGAPLRNSQGEETGAVYGFLNTLLSLIAKYAPEYLVVAFDSPQRTFRHDQFENYKANRPAMPEGLSAQLPVLFELLDAMGLVHVNSPGYEADDIIATLARRWRGDVAVRIVSGDKDLLQLIDERVHVIRPGKGAVLEQELDGNALLQLTGLRPEQFVDYLSLVGDSTDNVPGVKGIGEKTAGELLARFGSLDAIYQHLEEVERPSLRRRLEEGRESAMESRALVRLRDDVPLDVNLAALARGEFRTPELERLMDRLEFRRLREQLFGAPRRAASGAAPPAPKLEQVTPLADAALVHARVHYAVVDTPARLAELVRELASHDEIAVDTETSSLDPMRAVLAGISICTRAGNGWYVPVASDLDEAGSLGLLPAARAPGLEPDEVRHVLGPVLSAPRPSKIGQNIKFDSIVLSRAGLPLGGIAFDTMVASYCLDPARRSHGLDALARELLAHDMIPFSSLFDKRAREKDIRRVALERVVDYACEDADYTLRLKRVFAPLIDASQVRSLFHDVEMPLSGLLTRMEMTGVRVDAAFLGELAERYGTRIAALEEAVYASVGERFNIASTPKLREVLFQRLKLRPARRTKTGYSTDADVLEGLSGQHKVVALLLEWRQLVKLKGTYVDALPRLIHPDSGRVHTSYNQAVASTGRLSSSDPNLQNIPIRTAEGREIRRAFVARAPGWVLLDADYSQIELRILAHLSGDAALQQAFREDADVHRATAARVMGIALEAVTTDMRSRAKVVNFGLVYGMGARGLAQSLGIETAEARRFIEDYFGSYPGVKRFIDETIAAARRERAVTTLLGRTRRLPDIDSSNPGARAFSERVAVNTPVQGTAADIIKLAMLSVDRELRARGLEAQLILQVHDELLLDVPESELESVRVLVRECMESAMDLEVPLKVDVGTGRNWLEAH